MSSEHQDEVSFENELSDGDIFEPDDIISLGNSSAEDTGDSSCDEIPNENEDTSNPTLLSFWKLVTVSVRTYSMC